MHSKGKLRTIAIILTFLLVIDLLLPIGRVVAIQTTQKDATLDPTNITIEKQSEDNENQENDEANTTGTNESDEQEKNDQDTDQDLEANSSETTEETRAKKEPQQDKEANNNKDATASDQEKETNELERNPTYNKRQFRTFMATFNQSNWQIVNISDIVGKDGLTKEEYLVKSLLGSGVVVRNIKFTGTDHSAGVFSADENVIGFEEGIILSTGSVQNVRGPNTSDSISTNNGLPGDEDLNTLIPSGSTYDATVLEFDFIPTSDELYFEYVFASDEYNEFVNSRYNDVFGFFVNGENVALIPGTNTPVSINTLNGGKPLGQDASHSEFYRNNDLDDGGGHIDTEMDGLTVVLPIKAKVNPGEYNHIKLAIADVGDSIYDSNVFIRSGSIVGQSSIISGLEAADNIRGQTPNHEELTVGEPIVDPIDSATGAQVINQSFLPLTGAIPFSFDVHYNSLLLNEGVMGVGWTHPYEMSITENDEGIVYVYWDSNRRNTFVQNEDGSYDSPDQAMQNHQLTKNNDGTFTLTTSHHEVYEFNQAGKIANIYDANQFVLTMHYNDDGNLASITEPISGQTLSFTYHDNGLLEKVSDQSGREVSFAYDENNLLTTLTDEANETTTYRYNENNQIEQATTSTGEQIFKNAFDNQGRVIVQEDAKGQESTFVYVEDEESGTLTTTYTNREGKKQIFKYNNKYQFIEHVDTLGFTTKYEYDQASNLIKEIDANGNVTSYTYDEHGNVTSITDALGHTTKFTYDKNNNTTSIENAKGDKVTLSYNERNQVTKVTNPLNQEITYEYDENGLLIKTTEDGNETTYSYLNGAVESVTNPLGGVVSFEYDAIGRIVKLIDEENSETVYQYDVNNNITEVRDALGNTLRYEYDRHGNLVKEIDAKGNTTTYAYDENNNLIKEVNPLNQAFLFAYDAEDRLISITDASGNKTKFNYDAKGQLIELINPLGHQYTVEYDAVGNVIKELDAYGEIISKATYDAVGNVTQIANALGHIESYEYDQADLLTKVTNNIDNVTSFKYDGLGRIVQSIDPIGGVNKQSFDSQGNRTSLTDANGNKIAFEFNKLGYLTKVIAADDNTITYEYNQRGQITKMTNGRGQETSYEYDAVGRISKLIEPDNISTYTYDENDNLIKVEDNLGTIEYKYDALDRIIEYTDVYGNTIKYDYDVSGNLSTLTYPNDNQVQYVYDQANQLIEVIDWEGRSTEYAYDKNGRLVETTRPNGTVETREYNQAGQLLSLKDVFANGEVINHYQYTYDDAGNIASETNETTVEIDLNTSELIATYGLGNQLASINGETVEYDEDGNLIKLQLPNSETVTYEYDARNRLVKTGDTEYTYTVNDHRIAMITDGVETRFVVDPNHELDQVLMETDSDGNVVRTYVYGQGLIGFEDAEGNYYAYHQDFRGSTTNLTDMNEQIVATYKYDPFGNIIYHDGTVEQPFLYVGRYGIQTDANGLIYMRARYYHPEIQRFLSEDIVEGSILLSQSFNRYAYAGNNPLTIIDPDGEFWHIVGGAVIGGLISGGVELVNGGSFWDVTSSAVGGAVAGGITAGLGPAAAGVGTWAVIGTGAGAGVVGDLTTKGMKREKPTAKSVVESAFFGALPTPSGASKLIGSTRKGLRYADQGVRRAEYGMSRTARQRALRHKRSLERQEKALKFYDKHAPNLYNTTGLTVWRNLTDKDDSQLAK